ncbi:DUF262 domain-containing protein [Photobacterium galatheae]|uniref:GmrSD restriction endonucleases N-terminal domain-containing protein n=1 Tax=Photobacterium galatheae TaxID=1654360 RepID=A0A066RKS1_9GAMM|nr:DUF262 domain-containing protein [Photobacterium galatheae]KDM90949.1 hypothetical protein EA58_14435 [Photobacterium galatheae]MCM0149086.1 DUF262 domain-containing protein [Photobacterium galatheae]
MAHLCDLNIGFEASDEAVSSLIHRYDEGDLVIDVDCQRGDVWDTKRASKLIESVCLGLPLPIFYTYECENYSELIDGKQRFLSFLKFVNNEYKLKNLKTLKQLNGKYFRDLKPSEQRQIKNHKLHVYSTHADSDEAKYEIFERLNTGGTTLKSQEIILGLNEGAVSAFAKSVSQKMIESKVERASSNKHKQLDSKVLQLMFFADNELDSTVATSHKKILHEVLNSPTYEEKLTSEYVDEAARMLSLTKESSYRMSKRLWPERPNPKENHSFREVLTHVFSKVSVLGTALDSDAWRHIAKPIENRFVQLIQENEENYFAFTNSTGSRPARRIKASISEELLKTMDEIV